MDTQNLKSRACLSSFIRYCVTHPEERFWQAVRNFSGYDAIMAVEVDDMKTQTYDTFYIQNKRHDD